MRSLTVASAVSVPGLELYLKKGYIIILRHQVENNKESCLKYVVPCNPVQTCCAM